MILLIIPKVWPFVAEALAALDFLFGDMRKRAYVPGVAGTCVSTLPQDYFEIYPSPPMGPDLLPVGPLFFGGARARPISAGIHMKTRRFLVCLLKGTP